MTARRDARRDMRVAIVGAGVMAEAMIAGLLADKAANPSRLAASHPRRDRRDQLASRHGISVVARNAEAVAGADIVVLAVKPQMLRSVMREVGPVLMKSQAVLSIVAGATLRTLTSGLEHAAVVRAMPNTPSQIRRGITVWTASPACTARQRELARSVLGAIGSEKEVGDETFVAMATALSGTGPTYLFAVMEALIDAGVHMGFPRELAHDLVVETLIGSAEYAAQSELHPAQLRNAVTSPGGTSAAAIYELEKGRIRTVLSDAVWAAYRRTLELGERLEEEAGS
jgi:pyrroline-5-carboxylate reductase